MKNDVTCRENYLLILADRLNGIIDIGRVDRIFSNGFEWHINFNVDKCLFQIYDKLSNI